MRSRAATNSRTSATQPARANSTVRRECQRCIKPHGTKTPRARQPTRNNWIVFFSGDRRQKLPVGRSVALQKLSRDESGERAAAANYVINFFTIGVR